MYEIPIQKVCINNKVENKMKEVKQTVELQWLKHLWNHENVFETGVVRGNEC